MLLILLFHYTKTTDNGSPLNTAVEVERVLSNYIVDINNTIGIKAHVLAERRALAASWEYKTTNAIQKYVDYTLHPADDIQWFADKRKALHFARHAQDYRMPIRVKRLASSVIEFACIKKNKASTA